MQRRNGAVGEREGGVRVDIRLQLQYVQQTDNNVWKYPQIKKYEIERDQVKYRRLEGYTTSKEQRGS